YTCCGFRASCCRQRMPGGGAPPLRDERPSHEEIVCSGHAERGCSELQREPRQGAPVPLLLSPLLWLLLLRQAVQRLQPGVLWVGNVQWVRQRVRPAQPGTVLR